MESEYRYLTRVTPKEKATAGRPAADHRGRGRGLSCMVEHAWVRIAELKQEAAFESWEAANPRLAQLRRVLRWLRIRWLNRLKDARESERGKQIEQRLRTLWAAAQTRALRGYLTATRWGGCRPNRKRALSLSTRALIEELERRGIDREDCVERRDLLDALCGEAGRDEAASDSEDELLVQSPVDKMV